MDNAKVKYILMEFQSDANAVNTNHEKGCAMAEIYLAGGCFWGTEKYLSSIRGVLSTQVGYANGKTENPTYE